MSEPHYDEFDSERPLAELAQYRSPHVLSILTLILGLLCFVALIRPTYWIIPIVTMALGGASLYSLARQPEKMGRKAALAGLVLAVVCLSWGASRYFSRQQWLCRQARECADAWMELVKEKQLDEAFQLHLGRGKRKLPGDSLEDFFSKQPLAKEEYEEFFRSNPMKRLVVVAPHSEIMFERLDTYDQLSFGDKLSLNYRVEFQEQGRAQELPVQLVMMRQLDSTSGDHYWRVEGVTSPKQRQ